MKTLLMAAALALATAANAQPAPAPQAAPAETAPAPAPAPAPVLPDADPALWVVRDDDTTIYLFGTFHLLDGRPWFNDEVKTAFDASDELVMEAIVPEDPASLGPMVIRYARSDGRTLSSRLSAEQNAAVGAALTAIGVPQGAFDGFDPWFVSTALALAAAQRLGIQSSSGPETGLAASARARGIPIAELEGFEWQFQLFDRMSDAQQIEQLMETVENNDELDEELAPMLAAWSAGDVDRLAAIMNEGIDGALYQTIFTDRNRNWAGWIQRRLERPGTVFVAVGAGHLAGDHSVQAILRERGVRSARVPHREAN